MTTQYSQPWARDYRLLKDSASPQSLEITHFVPYCEGHSREPMHFAEKCWKEWEVERRQGCSQASAMGRGHLQHSLPSQQEGALVFGRGARGESPPMIAILFLSGVDTVHAVWFSPVAW